MRRARPGGSITPAIHGELRSLLDGGKSRDKKKRLRILERVEVKALEWIEGGGSSSSSEWRVQLDGGKEEEEESILHADAIWLATGHTLDVTTLQPLTTLMTARPQAIHDGLPTLTPSLKWDAGTNLYVAGAFAALQLGPDALNLAGAGLSAARIVSDLEECGWPLL